MGKACQKGWQIQTFFPTHPLHTHTHTHTYRSAGLAGEDGASLDLVHVEVLQVGLVDLPSQGLLVGQLGVLHLPLPRLDLRLQLQLLRLGHPAKADGWGGPDVMLGCVCGVYVVCMCVCVMYTETNTF